MQRIPTARSNSGFSLLEILIASAMVVIVALVASKVIIPYVTLFTRSHARQQAIMQSRQCIETIRRFMGNGQVSTLNIPSVDLATTPVGAPQNSSVSFTSADGTAHYSIYWDVGGDVVIKQWSPPNTPTPTVSVLASQVTELNFTADFRDPAMVYLTLQIDAPLENGKTQGSPGSTDNNFSLLLDKQTMRMVIQ